LITVGKQNFTISVAKHIKVIYNCFVDGEEYSKVIKVLRVKQGLTQKDLATKLSISPSLVSQWESGWKTPNISEVLKLSKLFNVSTDFILTGKTIKTRTEEIEQSKSIQYDFYKYLNKEYDLKEHPELISKHFEYLWANPEKNKEIPSKLGEWYGVRVIKRIDYLNDSYRPRYQKVVLELVELINNEYIFDMVVQCSPTWNMDYQHAGKIKVKIDFDEKYPRYCAEMNFEVDEKIFAKHLLQFMCTDEDRRKRMLNYVFRMIAKLLNENNIGNEFLTTDCKDNKFTLRESETNKKMYIVIPKTPNNKIFWDNKQDDFRLEDEESIKCDENYKQLKYLY